MHSKIWVHLYEEPLEFISPFNGKISSIDHQKEAKALNYKIAILILQIQKRSQNRESALLCPSPWAAAQAGGAFPSPLLPNMGVSVNPCSKHHLMQCAPTQHLLQPLRQQSHCHQPTNRSVPQGPAASWLSWSTACTCCDQLREAASRNKHFTCLENNVTGKKTEKLTKQSISHQINSLWLEHLRQTTVTGTDMTWPQMGADHHPRSAGKPFGLGVGDLGLRGAASREQQSQSKKVKLHI